MEDSENLLILHLRTAGIRKSKEIELVNEVINIREKRKQIFSAFKLELDVRETAYQKLQLLLAKTRRDNDSFISAQSVLMTAALGAKNSDTEALIKNLELKYSREKDDCIISMKLKSENNLQAYKLKLKKVDEKVEELIAAKASYESKGAGSTAYDLSLATITDLNDYHESNVQK